MSAQDSQLEVNLNGSFAAVYTRWIDLVFREKLPFEQDMVGHILTTYCQQLASITQTSTGFTLLPASFQMYASCVTHMLDVCKSLNVNSNTITITTLLTKGLETWCNLVTTMNAGHRFDFTTPEWEAYKQRNAELCLHPDKHSIQLRRIVDSQVMGTATDVWIFVPDNGHALTPVAGRRVPRPRCLTLLDGIHNVINHGGNEFLLHMLAIHDTNCHCGGNGSGWMPVTQLFDHYYHNKRHHQGNLVNPQAKGVFYSISSRCNELQRWFDDIFIVDCASAGFGNVGIAYDVDELREISGIVILNDEQIAYYLRGLESIWDECGKSD